MPRRKPTRKALGAWYTPVDLLDVVTTHVLEDFESLAPAFDRSRPVRVLDPACGDGRFLEAVRVRLHLDGFSVEATGCDVDADAIASIRHPSVRTIHADALTHDWGDERFDIVIGNPPFLSQMASETSRGGASHHGGGPYANAAAEFLALAVRLAEPGGSVVGLVLPQSILASRDAGPVRDRVDEIVDHTWSWWEPDQRRLFDAAVNVCALGFRLPKTEAGPGFAWTRLVTDALGIPPIDPSMITADGSLGDRADLNANFRDEYYALVGAVGDDADGPIFITSGLIDPGRSLWGERPVKFAKQSYRHPRVDLSRLEGRFAAWAQRKIVPKVLVANQTSIVEAVADVDGSWLPGVPVTAITPTDADPATRARHLREIEAVLTSPVASAWCWHIGGGTGMSSTAVRLNPATLAHVPWPAGDLGPAVAALADGDPEGCGSAVLAAFGLTGEPAAQLLSWWRAALPHRP